MSAAPTTAEALGEGLVHYRNAFLPTVRCEDHGEAEVPVKLYEGDGATDVPEFDEVAQSAMTLRDFVALQSGRHQVKLALPCESCTIGVQIGRENQRLLVDAFGDTLAGQEIEMRNFRISAARWSFPEHVDSGNQLVAHLEGTKRWWWRRPDGSEGSVDVHAGDVLFLPIGVPHRTRNLSEACIITSVGWSERSGARRRLRELCTQLYPGRVASIAAGCDEFDYDGAPDRGIKRGREEARDAPL